jgi:hypothetical protein
MKGYLKICKGLPLIAVFGSLPALAAVTVKPVPFDPTNFSTAHTAILGVQLILGATVDLGGSTDTFTFSWNFGDGSPVTPATVTNPYNISATHIYTSGTAGVTTWTAVVTVTDTNTSAKYTGNYPIALQANNLQARVDIAIDNGLWYLHTSMWRGTDTVFGTGTPWGGWDANSGSTGCPSGGNFACGLGAAGLTATNVQAYMVGSTGHLETGPSADPYTDDVKRAVQRLFFFMEAYPVQTRTVSYNPAFAATRCSDGSLPTGYLTHTQSCPAGTTLINENPGAASCGSGSCPFVFDVNSNGQMVTVYNDSYFYSGYENGMLIDALVATQNPGGTALTGYTSATNPITGTKGVRGLTYLTIVQDIVDQIGYCENSGDPGNTTGSDQGGAWQYYCADSPFAYGAYEYNDNSPSQWDAIGLIAANRGAGFGIPINPIIRDTNQVWLTWSQDWAGCCVGTWGSGSAKGAFGYSQIDSFPWGPFADTPSGMVQLTLDNVGLTNSSSPDQRWNMAESFYHDNFCSTNASGYYAPKAYTYGMFSFTKAMLLHSPGGVLTPLQFLADEPSGTNPIDWYAAQAANGDACDGVAQTLVSRQASDGHWFSEDYDCGPQCYFETAWSIIMLNKTVFGSCVNDLTGKGTAGGRTPPRVDLTWTALANVASYNVLRGPSNGGPYNLVGNSTAPSFSDRSGLSDHATYYYVLQPLNTSGSTVCQSNQTVVAVP